MNAQANYVIQGFLIALLFPVAGFIMNKIKSAEKVNETIFVRDKEELSESAPPSPELNKGKNLFLQKCATCHQLFRESTGPALNGFQYRGSWADRDKLHEWIKNPALYIKSDMYTKQLKEKYVGTMTGFPDISKEEVNTIADYIIWAAEN